MKIVIVRHGDAVYSNEDRILSVTGRKEAAIVGEKLKRVINIDYCYSSPKTRALETSSLICDALGFHSKIEYLGELTPSGNARQIISFIDATIEMEKTELGFQAEIQLCEGDSFNLCFKNENDEWDNNDNQNYIFELEKPSTELIVLEDEPMAIGSARKLRRSYLWSKKIKLAVYKIITYLPKIISGNYKRKSNNED